MRIQPGILIENSYIKTNSPTVLFQNNQIISGKILDIEGNKLNILFPGGIQVKASLEGSLSLTANSYVDFQIIEVTNDLMIIKPVKGEDMAPASRERILNGLASAVNVKPAPENMKFLERCRNLFGSSLLRLGEVLLSDGKTDIYNILKEIFIEPEKLKEYLKGFDKENSEKLISQLKTLFESVKEEGKTSPAFARILGDIAKSLLIQINHPFPIFYIPLPIIFNNKLYPSEIWIEKDRNKDGESKDNISIHLLLDTPYLGRIEAGIICSGSDLGVDLYCNRENLQLFDKSLHILKERMSSIGFNPKWINVHELKENSGFITLSQKYIKPLPPLDVRV